MVPKGWSEKTLEDIALVERGKFSARPRNDPKYFGGDVPFVQTGDVSSAGTYLEKFSQTLNQDGIGVSKVFPRDTILITIAANIGDTAITKFDVACPDSVVAIKPYHGKADVYWLKKLLETKRDALDSLSTQNAQKNINLQVLKPFQLLVPPVNEQKKIAQILSTWDQAIATTERLLDLARQQRKALMQQLLTGIKRFPGFEGEWKSGVLGGVANIDSGFAFKSDNFSDGDNAVPVIRMSDFKSGALDLSSPAKVMADVLLGLDRFALKSNDFVFGMSGSLSNYAWVKESNLPCYLNQRVGRIVAKDNVDQMFVTYLYLSDRIQQSILDKAAGAAQLNISVTDLRTMNIKYPCLQEQRQIAQVLTTSYQEIQTLQSQLDGLKQEKKALMQQLLTGKRRVQYAMDEAEA